MIKKKKIDGLKNNTLSFINKINNVAQKLKDQYFIFSTI